MEEQREHLVGNSFPRKMQSMNPGAILGIRHLWHLILGIKCAQIMATMVASTAV